MKKIGLYFIVIPFISGCDSAETDISSKPRATTQYSQTLDHTKETADQFEKSLSTSAQRTQDATNE